MKEIPWHNWGLRKKKLSCFLDLIGGFETCILAGWWFGTSILFSHILGC